MNLLAPTNRMVSTADSLGSLQIRTEGHPLRMQALIAEIKCKGGCTQSRVTRLRWARADARLLTRAGAEGVVAAAAADFDVEPLDFLVQGGKRNKKAFRGFGLVPVGALEHIHDDAALDLIHDLKQRRVGVV